MRSKSSYKRPSGRVQVSLLLPEKLVEELQKVADKEHRSRNGQVEHLLTQWHESQQASGGGKD